MTVYRRVLIVAGLLLLNFQLVFSFDYPQFNRYQLSYDSIFNRRASVCAGCSTDTSFRMRENEDVALVVADDQKIYANVATIAGIEAAEKQNRFGVVRSAISYKSEYLTAKLSADVYSVERQAVSRVGDVAFERFIKEDAQVPIEGVFDFRGNIPEAFIRAKYKAFTLSTGKMKLRWGPGYKGTLGLSGTSYSPFYLYDLKFKFDEHLHAQAFLCGYDDEAIYKKEISSNDKIVVKNSGQEVKTFLPRYGAGQRLDFRVGSHLRLGIYELVDFFGANELNRFANPLQMYYLANEASGTNNANMLAGIDFKLIFTPFRFYGEFINDDITVFEKNGNPDKYAFQVGGEYYGNDPLVATGLEYTHLSKYIYGHSRVLSRHSYWGESMGWPWGNYMDVVTAYAVFRFVKNINGRVEANYWLSGNGSITDEWYIDGKPDLDDVQFFPEHATKTYSMIISAEYQPFPWLTYAFYYEPVVQHKKLCNEFYTYLQCRIPDFRKSKEDK